MEISTLSFFAVGLAYGMLHAFDPDHVAAVTGMAAGRKQNLWKSAFHWSLGHGGTVLLFALLVFFAGIAIPHSISEIAETCVAYVLIGIGILGVWKVNRVRKEEYQPSESNRYGASFVGMLHGTAGSAPLLTLIPLSKVSEPTIGVIYVLLFCLGVSIAMLSLGGLIGQGAAKIQRINLFWHHSFHLALGAFAFAFGLYLLFS